MQHLARNIALLILLTVASIGYAQIPRYIDTASPNTLKIVEKGYPNVYLWNDSLYYIVGPCKNNYRIVSKKDYSPFVSIAANQPVQPFLSVRGNIQYEYLYRSYVDTPFAQRDFSQHTIQSNLTLSIRNQYPIQIIFRTRVSNSPFFKNSFDLNAQFNRDLFLQKIKSDLKGNVTGLLNTDRLQEYERFYQEKLRKVNALQGWIQNPMRDQEIIEERERALREKASINLPDSLRKLTLLDSLIKANDFLADKESDADSLKTTYPSRYQDKKGELEKELAEAREWEKKIAQVKKQLQKDKAQLLSDIGKIGDPSALKQFMRENNIDSKTLPKGYKTLLAINKIGIGRNWIDYSELTVKNIIVTGVNVETNFTPFFFAVTGGKINFGYRDFLIKNNRFPNQNLAVVRAGIGRKESSNLIFTYYQGRKSLLNSYNGPQTPVQQVSGISVESQLRIDKETLLTFEVAKSNVPSLGNRTADNDKMLDFKTRKNEAYAIKLTSLLTPTTKVNGYYM